MKRIIFALMVLLFATGTYAASIDVQESIPANTVWSFSVTLPDAGDFDDARILLNGNRLISFYTNPTDEIIAFDEDNSRLFSITEPVGNTVYFLVSPLGNGNHEIILKVDGSNVDEESVDFFAIYDADERANLQNQVTGLRGSINTLVEQFNSIEDSLKTALNEEDRIALQASIDSLQASMAEMETGLEAQDADNLVKINAVNKYLQEHESAENASETALSAGMGMFSIGSIGPEAQAGILFIIVAIVAAVLVIKFKDKIPKKGLYGKAKEAPVFSQRDEDIADQVMTESQDEAKRGRWASEGSEPVEKSERKAFNVGDLLKKD